ncbi:MAG: hypothetical protein C0392_08980 [Syntrophus sp. (in: bacteria)]|nr:hypothetical protein [Syntrophus sp. (in: bacteria)]
MFSKFFIERPIFATVIALIIVIAGLVAMKLLSVAQYPTITPVQIQVTTTYPGVDSKTVGDSVAAPIEAQINGVDNMLYMTSVSSNTGQLTINVYFALDTNPDIAQVLVQNRVALAMPQLPQLVTQYGVSVQKKSASPLMVISVFNKDGRYSHEYVTNYANIYVLDAIKRVNGAGQATIPGVPDQAMRIWMNPDKMASLGITTSDIQQAVANQNALFGAGQMGQEPSDDKTQLTFPVVTQAPFMQPVEYENIILRADTEGTAIVRVKDVARAEVGRRQYIDDNKMNGMPSTPIIVYQQPGANGIEVSKAVRKTMADLKSTMPDGASMKRTSQTTAKVDELLAKYPAVAHRTILNGFSIIDGQYKIVFLILAAQFESWTLPGSVMTAVPFGILGALMFNWIRGLENDVYFQIGLLVLIGLGAKNAVLRVTFAVELRKQGLSIMDATIKAGEERLRPIIMTSLAFILGVLPLALATGAGANARHSIGTGIMGGMIGEATMAMLYVPLFFYLFDRLAERGEQKKKAAPKREPPAPKPYTTEEGK